MNNTLKIALIYAIVLNVASVGSGQSPDKYNPEKESSRLLPSIQELINQSSQDFDTGDLKKAQASLDEAGNATKKLPQDGGKGLAKELNAEILIRKGQLALKDNDIPKSIELFNQVVKDPANPRQKAVAQVNAAAAHMRAKQAEKAVVLMKECDWDQLDPGQLPILYYNYARALEESGKFEEAVIRYARSLRSNYDFEPSSKRLQTLALRISGDDPAKVDEIGRQLNYLEVPSVAANYAIALLNDERIDPQSELAQSSLAVLLNAWAQLYTNPDSFAKDNVEALRILSQAKWTPFLMDVQAAQRVTLNLQGYLSRRLDSRLSLAPFEWCTSGDRPKVRDAFALYLAATADPYLQQALRNTRAKDSGTRHNLEQAFTRVYGAWTLNPGDLGLARRVASLTHDFRTIIDPEGVARNRLVEAMMEQKGATYERLGEVHGNDVDEWKNVLELHTFLGLLFEADGIYGDEGIVRSAIGQWTYALRAANMIRELTDNGDYRFPGLYEHLATCLSGKKDLSKAFDRYVQAADEYLAGKQFTLAKRAVDSVNRLEYAPTAEQKTRLDKARIEIARLESAAKQEE